MSTLVPGQSIGAAGTGLPDGCVLAGGAGRRFGRPKAGVRLGDRTLVERAVGALLPRCGRVVVVSRPEGATEFKPLKARWVVERTFAWLGRYRCLSKDHEHTPESSETVVRLAAIHHMLRRLRPTRRARSQRFRFKPRPRKRAA